ncbi:conserved hypothetical protein [Latilactobacillus fuchuensis]|jgi:Mg2+ and Co2+ transporter CorA|uniref:Uncharacterized protein n=3 Tax=Latilactobacillus fuchuensis TaxID=164393 RepID=A0A2N9DTM3_9LACO|nr:hypothetical protein [Latilactobacillus fuchuensis]KRL58666.1 hypothetical protein FC69_GL000096 [Latilactobacillus fuchuensis DSM 14340 = JCM 11249]SPC36966.1 conserved hypothetical protein [Latilactobacillus fuchuensis]
MMKTRYKILIGVGATAAIGATTAFVGSKALFEKIERYRKRLAVKSFVKEKLHGNQKALALVDQLSDTDVNNLLNAADKLNDLKDKLGEQTDNIPEMVNDLRQTLTAYATKVKEHL